MMLFIPGKFKFHSGSESEWKIECDNLEDSEISLFARQIASQFQFDLVVGVPRGGLRLASELEKYQQKDTGRILLVDDVLTTGNSMELHSSLLNNGGCKIVGVVLFARGPCPDWITPLYQLNRRFWE